MRFLVPAPVYVETEVEQSSRTGEGLLSTLRQQPEKRQGLREVAQAFGLPSLRQSQFLTAILAIK